MSQVERQTEDQRRGTSLNNRAVTVTVPLQITISLGQPVLGAAGAAITLPMGVSEARGAEFAEGAVVGAPPAAYSKFSAAALASQAFSWSAAISTADCSHLAYEEPPAVRDVCENLWQLDACQFVQRGATQCFIAATDRTVIVAFRGTKGALDWFSNLNVLERRTSMGSVHDGFYRALETVRIELEALIEPLAGTRELVLTGHSLGGALATLAAAHWHRKFDIASVYTFGQPCVGFRSFQAYMATHLAGRFFRFVNDDDIVPRVPPRYVHVGNLIWFDWQGNIREWSLEAGVVVEPPTLSFPEFERAKEEAEIIKQTSGSEMAQLEGLIPNYFSDHKLSGYLNKLMRHLG